MVVDGAPKPDATPPTPSAALEAGATGGGLGHAFLCSGQWARWHVVVQYMTLLQRLQVLLAGSAQTAQGPLMTVKMGNDMAGCT